MVIGLVSILMIHHRQLIIVRQERGRYQAVYKELAPNACVMQKHEPVSGVMGKEFYDKFRTLARRAVVADNDRARQALYPSVIR